MNTPTPLPNPLAAIPFVEKSWAIHEELVRKFQLKHRPGGVIVNWSIPSYYVNVTCGVPDPDAYELADALRTIQRTVESLSGLDVTLMLDASPAAEQTTA